ncbi:MAG: hypothetical protein IT442_09540 [Phycisphaeraceae bacterium]|nr:hypothetical protein [Phycisphaeraceae bacterium]
MYYKALRPDGTDFATGTTKPRKGRWLPRIDGELVMCKRGYHVSDAPAETLVNGSWPCKLARVEIPDGEWDRDGHKLVVPTYRVVEWLPAWQALGPNGEAVAVLIERARRLTANEVLRLFDAWHAAGYDAWHAVWHAARDAARDAAGYAAGYAARDAVWHAARDAAGYAAGYAVGDAARDAAWALFVRDLISPEQFDILYGPWASVIGDTHG